MADALSIVLRASGEAVGSGQGVAADLGELRSALRLTAVATVPSGTTLDLTIETSPDGAVWSTVGSFPTLDATGHPKLCFGPCERYVRVAWEVDGDPVTFGVLGEAHVLYAGLDDLTTTGVTPRALAEVDASTKVHALLQATADVDAALATRYKLPLQAWPEDLRGRCASRAVYYVLKHRGFDPEGQDAVLILDGGLILDNGAATATERWLRGVAQGQIHPVGIVDSTPAKREFGARVRSRARRGWDAC